MMPAPLQYMLVAQGALLVLVGLYYMLLRRLSFHGLNRAYLLGSLIFAWLVPALPMRALLEGPAPAALLPLPELLVWEGAASAPVAAPVAAGFSPEPLLLAAYAVGVLVLVLVLLVQVASLVRLHRASQPAVVAGVAFRAVAASISTFSFGRHIYLCPTQHAPADLPLILLHEQVHVRQAHSLDVLLGHLHRVLAWVSPAAWLWLRAVQENLEFVADAAVLRESARPARQYQYTLVQLSALAPGPALVSPFSFITLKNRILMMNAPVSGPAQLLRYVAVVPVALSLLLLAPTTKASSALPAAPAPVQTLKTTPAEIEKPAPISALPPAALAYIVKTYPGYRLIGLTEVRASADAPVRYKAEIAYGRRPQYVLFDAQGQVVATPLQGTSPLEKATFIVDGKELSREEGKAAMALGADKIAMMWVFKGKKSIQTADEAALRRDFGAKLDNGLMLILTKEHLADADVQAFLKRYRIRYVAPKSDGRAYAGDLMRKLNEGQGLTDEEIGGRFILLNDVEATAAQLRALPAGTVTGFAISDDPVAKFGAKAAKGLIMVTTKQP